MIVCSPQSANLLVVLVHSLEGGLDPHLTDYGETKQEEDINFVINFLQFNHCLSIIYIIR